MISLTVLFWVFIILFAIIGAMRGWSKELLVTFSVILALFLIEVLETYLSFYKKAIVDEGGATLFWVRTIIVVLLAFFGYQTPNIRALAGARFARERIQDTLLGFVIGAINGYLIVGSLWWYLNAAGYPFAKYISAPSPGTDLGDAAAQIINLLPPEWLVIPWVYFAVGVAFLFVIVVFI
jgi:uncharacterized membrane protein required for colicin V production